MINIPFPLSYKKALLAGTKNITLRIKNEQGKYSKGKVYEVTSYSGVNWNIKIKVQEVITSTVNQLSNFDIPQRTINSIMKQDGISKNSRVDIIKFKTIV